MLLVTDDFNRANGAPGSNWSAPSGLVLFTILNSAAVANNQSGTGYWSAGTFHANQFAQAVVQGALDNYRYVAVGVRLGGANGEGYYLETDGTDTWIEYVDSTGTWADLQVLTGTAFANGDVMRLEIVGSTLQAFKNGTQIGTDETVTQIASGSPGIYVSPDNYAIVDDFEAGDLSGQMARLGSSIRPAFFKGGAITR